MLIRRYGIGVPIAVAALAMALLIGGCFGGSDETSTTTTQAPRSQAQLMVLRGGKTPGLQVLLLRRGQKVYFSPGEWVFPGAPGSEEGAASAAAVGVLADQAGIKAPADLVPYAEWVVLGFDTRFYLALAPANSTPRPDGTEAVEAGWYVPKRALDLHRAGKLPMTYATIKQLESLVPFATATDALDSARGREVQPVQLRVIGQGDKRRPVLPEDAP
jgi:hypothetical protein